ncbi:MAG: protein arginine kinase [Clostridiales bacterium]|jgi:protein arginine kinase|nr:protein arginine kinase [Clostridiales bacterium]
MEKWYEKKTSDSGVIISTRIRLARNIKNRPFPGRLNEKGALSILNQLKDAIAPEEALIFEEMTDKSKDYLHEMVERHLISPEFALKTGMRGIAALEDESVCIMLNEEDHVRIQAVCSGDDIEQAYVAASQADDLIENSVDYAFDAKFGYLTSCPTNAGTGMRASFMLHLPALAQTGGIAQIIQAAGKFGMALRGMHGEGSDPLGCIFQLSNQATLGKSENVIIAATKSLAHEITEQEMNLKEKIMRDASIVITDKVYRSYGILANCRTIKLNEAMALLSNVRMGYIWNILDLPHPKANLYFIMMEIQHGSIIKRAGRHVEEKEEDCLRADFVREMFNV